MKKRSTVVPKGRKQAIDAFCKECIYDPDGGTGSWRLQVQACTANLCPLFTYRPIPHGAKR